MSFRFPLYQKQLVDDQVGRNQQVWGQVGRICPFKT